MIKTDFLNQVVLGYIKKDLENINTLPKRPGEAGNNNFPIALCVLSYMEYLGSFFTLKDSNNFDENVKVYTEKCFRDSSIYHPAILGDLFRNGLAHDYFARGGVARDGNRTPLYRNYDNIVVLDAETLLVDFLDSLERFGSELTDDNFNKRIQTALGRISTTLTTYNDEIKKLPFIGDLPGVHTSGATTISGMQNITKPYNPDEK